MEHLLALGSGRALYHGVGFKAGLLDRCAAAGIQVPAGVILLDEARDLPAARQESAPDRLVMELLGAGPIVLRVRQPGESEPSAPAVPGSASLDADLPGRAEAGSAYLPNVAIRSAFSAEDTPGRSLAGHFTSVLDVDPADPGAVGRAILEVWQSAEGFEPTEPGGPDSLAGDAEHPGGVALGRLRRDVLIMEMVPAIHAGVAAMQPDFEDDLVEMVEGTADTLVGSEKSGRRAMLPRLRAGERASRGPDRVPLPPWAVRLSVLLTQLRDELGDYEWDVEWADDGESCWLVQVRPLTVPVRRREALSRGNFAEIFPDVPSPFMASLIAEYGPRLFDLVYRRVDESLPTSRPFALLVDGRPYLNLSVVEDMLRRYGLPTGMLATSVGGRQGARSRLRPMRVAKSTLTLARLAVAELRVPAEVPEIAARLAGAAERAETEPGLAPAVDAAGEAYTQLMYGMVNLATFIGPAMSLLRKAGTLANHAEGHMTATTEMWEDLTRVADGLLSREDWLALHGHRGTYETDLAEPRFAEAPTVLDAAAGATSKSGSAAHRGRDRGGWRLPTEVTAPLWWLASRAVRAREGLRSDAMREFARIRAVLLQRAEAAVTRGQLAAVDDLWYLTAAEVRSLDDGWRVPERLPAQRRAARAERQQQRAPDFVPGDSQVVRPPGSRRTTPSDGMLTGLGLTHGKVHGRAWVLGTPSATLPEGWSPADTVLVTRAVDAGWVGTFALVSGVVVEIGGDLSHGSILLREIGIPAVTNVAGATVMIPDGAPLLVDATHGRVILGVDD